MTPRGFAVLFAAVLLLAAPPAARAQVDSLLAAGRAASARGDHAEAWRILRSAYDPATDDRRVLASLAGAAASTAEMPRFRALLDSVVDAGSGARNALEYWAALSLDAGAAPAAVGAEVAAHLAARPTDVEALLALVRVLRAHRAPDVAVELIGAGIGRGVDPARVGVALGDARRDQGDAVGALDAWLGVPDDPEASERIRLLLADRPPGHALDPLIERLRRAQADGPGATARLATTFLAEIEQAAAPPAEPAARAPACASCSPSDPVAAARDTTELAAALRATRPLGADARLVALRTGDLWLSRGVADSAIASYARSVDPSIAPDLGPSGIDALARIRLVRGLARAPRGSLAALGALLIGAEADPVGAAARLDTLALGLADSSGARPLAAALAAEWRGIAGDAAGASAALEAAAETAGAEAPALLLAAGRWAAAAREDERARTLWRAVVERYDATPYALEARRLLAQPASEGR